MFEETMFEMRKEPIYVRNPLWNELGGNGEPRFKEVNGLNAIRRTDNHDVLSVMSNQYEPIRDYDVLQKFLGLFNEANIEVQPIQHHINRSKDGVMGRTTFMEVQLPAFSLLPDTIEEQKMRIIIPNSNNGTTKLKMMIMFWRMVCKNGMMGWKSEFEFGFKHRNGALDRLGDALNLYLVNNINQVGNVVNLLGNVQGQVDPVIAYLNNNRILNGERWQERLMGHWLRINTSTNLWDLYNLFTNEITHNYGRNFGAKIAKLDLLNHEVKHVWGRQLGAPLSFEEAIWTA